MAESSDRATLVLGVGNPLMGDEGVGPRVVEHLLTSYGFPSNVQVVDAGTMGFGILNLFRDVNLIIVVDAIRGTSYQPGTVVSLDPADMAPNQVLHSLHDARLPDVLDAARLMGLEPEVRCIAVQIEHIVPWTTELSPAVESAVEHAGTAVIEMLRELGIEVWLSDTAEGDAPESARILRSLRRAEEADD